MPEVMEECISLMVRRPPRRQGHHTATNMEKERMNPVVHCEMPYEDRERMATFYGVAFGWQTQMLGEDMGQYVLATTTETDANGPKTPGD